MRTMRLGLAGLTSLALLVGVGGAVISQDEADAVPVAHVTGTIIDTFYDDSTAEYTESPGEVHHMKGATYVETNEWSDARLPAEKRMVLDFTTYPYEGDRLMVTRTSIRMDDEQGSWVGTGVGLSRPDGTSQGQDVLIGEGAYDGLFAVLTCGSAAGCEGYIFAGEMPPQPGEVPPAG